MKFLAVAIFLSIVNAASINLNTGPRQLGHSNRTTVGEIISVQKTIENVTKDRPLGKKRSSRMFCTTVSELFPDQKTVENVAKVVTPVRKQSSRVARTTVSEIIQFQKTRENVTNDLMRKQSSRISCTRVNKYVPLNKTGANVHPIRNQSSRISHIEGVDIVPDQNTVKSVTKGVPARKQSEKVSRISYGKNIQGKKFFKNVAQNVHSERKQASRVAHATAGKTMKVSNITENVAKEKIQTRKPSLRFSRITVDNTVPVKKTGTYVFNGAISKKNKYSRFVRTTADDSIAVEITASNKADNEHVVVEPSIEVPLTPFKEVVPANVTIPVKNTVDAKGGDKYLVAKQDSMVPLTSVDKIISYDELIPVQMTEKKSSDEVFLTTIEEMIPDDEMIPYDEMIPVDEMIPALTTANNVAKDEHLIVEQSTEVPPTTVKEVISVDKMIPMEMTVKKPSIAVPFIAIDEIKPVDEIMPLEMTINVAEGGNLGVEQSTEVPLTAVKKVSLVDEMVPVEMAVKENTIEVPLTTMKENIPMKTTVTNVAKDEHLVIEQSTVLPLTTVKDIKYPVDAKEEKFTVHTVAQAATSNSEVEESSFVPVTRTVVPSTLKSVRQSKSYINVKVEPTVKNVTYIEKDANAAVLRSEAKLIPDGFNYSYETSNGIAVSSIGTMKKVDNVYALVMEGQYQYISPEGVPVLLTYIADETGFHPESDMLPVAPPVPEAILRSLGYSAAHPTDQPIKDGIKMI